MAVTTVVYSANTAITLDLSSLGTSSTFIAGRESTQIDNTTNKYHDAIVMSDGITGGSTAPAVGQLIAVYAWGSDVSLATTAIDTLVGTDAARTITATTLAALRLLAPIPVVTATGSLVYRMQPTSVAALFGGVLPKFWGLFVAHNHTGALAAGNSAKFEFVGIKYDVT